MWMITTMAQQWWWYTNLSAMWPKQFQVWIKHSINRQQRRHLNQRKSVIISHQQLENKAGYTTCDLVNDHNLLLHGDFTISAVTTHSTKWRVKQKLRSVSANVNDSHRASAGLFSLHEHTQYCLNRLGTLAHQPNPVDYRQRNLHQQFPQIKLTSH